MSSPSLSRFSITSAEKVAKTVVKDVLCDVESIVGGEFHEKSSCSLISLRPKTCKDAETVADRRLVNWQRWMEIRKKESDKLRKATLRSRHELLLNLNPNDFRATMKRKEILDKFAVDPVLNFWQMPEKTRENLYLTLPKSQQNSNKPEIVYTQTPDLILEEQNIARGNRSQVMREKILQHVKREPSMKHLALKGNFGGNAAVGRIDAQWKKFSSNQLLNNNLQDSETATEVQRLQALMINDIQVDSIFPDTIIHIDLMFEGFKWQRYTKNLRLENRGEIAMNLTFKRTADCATKSFFFDDSTFRVIPGDVIEVPFHFYPNQPGVTSETLSLICHPAFSDNCGIRVMLQGRCDKKHKNTSEIIDSTINDIIQLSTADCQSPRRNLYKDPCETAFIKINPKLHYHSMYVDNLSQIFTEITGDREWDLDVNALYKMILGVNDTQQQKNFYEIFNGNMKQLKNRQRNDANDDEATAKFTMVRNIFGAFFDEFEDNMSDGSDAIKKNLSASIGKIVIILES